MKFFLIWEIGWIFLCVNRMFVVIVWVLLGWIMVMFVIIWRFVLG